MRSLTFVVLFVTLAIATAFFVHSGIAYQTGYQWFDSCWTQTTAKRKPLSPQEEISWKQCEPAVERAVYGAGMHLVGDRASQITPAFRLITAVCPSTTKDVPLGGLQYLAVRLIAEQGGPGFRDRFLPPESMIAKAFLKQWPECVQALKSFDIPKIVMRSNSWELESACNACEAEADAQRQAGIRK